MSAAAARSTLAAWAAAVPAAATVVREAVRAARAMMAAMVARVDSAVVKAARAEEEVMVEVAVRAVRVVACRSRFSILHKGHSNPNASPSSHRLG